MLTFKKNVFKNIKKSAKYKSQAGNEQASCINSLTRVISNNMILALNQKLKITFDANMSFVSPFLERILGEIGLGIVVMLP